MKVVRQNYNGVEHFLSPNDLVQCITHVFCSDTSVNTCAANPTETQHINDYNTGSYIYCTVLLIVILECALLIKYKSVKQSTVLHW